MSRPKGFKHTENTKKILSAQKLGNKNPSWKGDNVSIQALHLYIKNYKPKPNFCERCKKEKPYDLANISGIYKRDINDFEWLCRRCHMIKDGRLEELYLHFMA